MADKIATRQAYGEALIELVEKNDKVVVLDADLANATQTCKVAKAHPENSTTAALPRPTWSTSPPVCPR